MRQHLALLVEPQTFPASPAVAPALCTKPGEPITCLQTAGYGVDFPFENYERMADFMRRCKGKASITDHPDIRRVFEGFRFETLDIRHSNTNQRQGKAEVSGER